jgi:hypothetical protein
MQHVVDRLADLVIEYAREEVERKKMQGKSHDEAMTLISRASSVTTLSYEEAIAVYLRARGILRDGNEMLGAPIPDDWSPAPTPCP